MVSELRGIQFGLIFGRKLTQAGTGSMNIGKIREIIAGNISDDGTV